MPRTDYDELWKKLPDGSMELVEQTERVVSDKEIEKECRPGRLKALAARPIARLTPVEKDDLLELLVKHVIHRED